MRVGYQIGHMEKFKGFSDPATGVHPFLPSWYTESKTSNIYKLKNSLIAIATWPLRICLILIALLLLPFKPLRPYGCRLLLASAGIWNMQLKNWGIIHEIKTAKDAIVFSNLTCFAEILMLEYAISPVFALAHSNGTLSILNFFEMMSHTTQFEIKTGKGTLANLANAADYVSGKHFGPLVVFPEMQKSNGNVILQWPKDFATNFNFARKSGCYAITCSYDNPKSKYNEFVTLPHTVGGIYWHLLNIALAPQIFMKCEIISKEIVGEVMKTESPVNELRKIMAHTLGKDGTAVSLDASKLAEFARYYDKNAW